MSPADLVIQRIRIPQVGRVHPTMAVRPLPRIVFLAKCVMVRILRGGFRAFLAIRVTTSIPMFLAGEIPLNMVFLPMAPGKINFALLAMERIFGAGTPACLVLRVMRCSPILQTGKTLRCMEPLFWRMESKVVRLNVMGQILPEDYRAFPVLLVMERLILTLQDG